MCWTLSSLLLYLIRIIIIVVVVIVLFTALHCRYVAPMYLVDQKGERIEWGRIQGVKKKRQGRGYQKEKKKKKMKDGMIAAEMNELNNNGTNEQMAL